MRRREFLAALGGAATWPFAWLIAVRAQQGIPTVGLLSGASFEGSYAPAVELVRQGLRDVGFVEGQNVLIEYRSADGYPERLHDLAGDLVRRQVAVIVVIAGANAVLAAKAATSNIPIVFAVGGDALEHGLVKNFNKPEANVTGMSFNGRQLAPKRLDLLSALVPQARLFGYLDNVATASERTIQDLLASARSIGVEVIVFYAGTAQEIDSAFEAMVQKRVQAMVVSPDAYFLTREEQIVSLSKLHALPAIYSASRAIKVGGLMSYAPGVDEMYRRAGVYTGRLLKGANVADLPVELPTRYSLGINLKTAKTLGLTIPPNLLALADEVIE